MPICRRLERQAVLCAAARTLANTGSNSEIITAIRPMTIINSTRVKARCGGDRFIKPIPGSLAEEYGCKSADTVLQLAVEVSIADVAGIAAAVGAIVRAVADVDGVISAQAINHVVSAVAEEVIVVVGTEDGVVAFAIVDEDFEIVGRGIDPVVALAAVDVGIDIIAADPDVIIARAAVGFAAEGVIEEDAVVAAVAADGAVEVEGDEVVALAAINRGGDARGA